MDLLYGHGGHLRDEDAPERVGQGGVHAYEVKLHLHVLLTNDLDLEALLVVLGGPLLPRLSAWIGGRGRVQDLVLLEDHLAGVFRHCGIGL